MSKSPSLSKKAPSKGGKKNEKVEITLLSDTIYASNEFEEKLFPEWNEEVLKQIMERDKQLLGDPEDVSAQTNKRPPSNSKKKGSTTEDSFKDVVAIDSSEIVFNEKCSEFSSLVKEWKPIKSKWEPRISRDLFPAHPYFERIKAKDPPKSAVPESKSKKKVEEKEPIPTQQELVLDSDEEEIIVEDFEKYTKVLDISNKGGWTKAFVSALYQIEECKEMIPFGSYLWERIWPKRPGSDVLPDISPWGRYYIKLRYKGKERIVIVDDKLPHDANGKIMFPISPYDEFWPSIILKGIIALSKGEEHLAFTDPLWCFSCLFSDFSMQPVSCESILDVISPLTLSLQSHKEWKSCFSLVQYLCKKPMDCDQTKRKLMFLKCKKDVDIESQGLKKDNLFRIEDISVFKGHTLLRVISNDVAWGGKYSYKNSSIWTADFETEIGFCYQDRRIEKRMKDFWIDLEELQDSFDCVYVAHEITQFKTVAFLGKHVTTTSPIVFYVTETSKLFVRLMGIKEDIKPKVTIQKASNWKKLTPSKLIYDFTISGFDSILPVTLPCKDDFDIFEIRFTNIENQYVEFISEKPLTFGKQEDIYTTKLSQSIQRTNALSSPTHNNNEWKVWSIHQLIIDKEGVFSARLLVDDISILPFTHLMLVNNETTDVVKSINGRIFPVKLFPSPQQYSLICYACPNRDLDVTSYSLETISENDVFDLDVAKSLPLQALQLKGRYFTNQERELFRYRIDTGEKTNLAFRLLLSESIPIKLTIFKVENDNSTTLLEFQTFDNETEIVVSNFVAFPSTKTSSIGYLLVCTIDEDTSLRYLESRLENAGVEFQQFLREKANTTSLSDLKLEEERPVVDTKNAKKDTKKPASAKKPAATQKAKKEAPKIPSKQDKPVLLTSQYVEGCENSSASTLFYSIDMFSTTPNVIYQEVNLKKQKIDQMVEEWETATAQHADKGKAAREKYIKQNLARILSQKEHSPRAELKIEKREESVSERKDREAKEKEANEKLIAQIKEKRSERSKSFEKHVNEITEQKLQALASTMKESFVENQKKIIVLKEQTLEEEKKKEIDRMNEEKNKKSLPNTARKPTK